MKHNTIQNLLSPNQFSNKPSLVTTPDKQYFNSLQVKKTILNQILPQLKIAQIQKPAQPKNAMPSYLENVRKPPAAQANQILDMWMNQQLMSRRFRDNKSLRLSMHSYCEELIPLTKLRRKKVKVDLTHMAEEAPATRKKSRQKRDARNSANSIDSVLLAVKAAGKRKKSQQRRFKAVTPKIPFARVTRSFSKDSFSQKVSTRMSQDPIDTNILKRKTENEAFTPAI